MEATQMSMDRCKDKEAVVHICNEICSYCFFAKLCLTLLRPQQLQLARILCPCDFPGKNTGVCCHFLLHGMFLTQTEPMAPALAVRFFTTDPPRKPSGILLGHKKEQNWIICRHVDGQRECHTERGVRKKKANIEY